VACEPVGSWAMPGRAFGAVLWTRLAIYVNYHAIVCRRLTQLMASLQDRPQRGRFCPQIAGRVALQLNGWPL
jgi:hypothetical protein